MPDPDHEPLSQAEQGRVLIQNAQRPKLAEYDRAIGEVVEKTQQLIKRSRALLEETKHQVPPGSVSFRPAVSSPLEGPRRVASSHSHCQAD